MQADRIKINLIKKIGIFNSSSYNISSKHNSQKPIKKSKPQSPHRIIIEDLHLSSLKTSAKKVDPSSDNSPLDPVSTEDFECLKQAFHRQILNLNF